MADRNKERKTGAAIDRPVSARARRKTNEEIASLAALQRKIHLASLQDKGFPRRCRDFQGAGAPFARQRIGDAIRCFKAS
jgi:hypothetical protein